MIDEQVGRTPVIRQEVPQASRTVFDLQTSAWHVARCWRYKVNMQLHVTCGATGCNGQPSRAIATAQAALYSICDRDVNVSEACDHVLQSNVRKTAVACHAKKLLDMSLVWLTLKVDEWSA